MMDIKTLYIDEKKSISEIAKILPISKSTIRLRLLEMGILRTRADGVKNAGKKGLLGTGRKNKSFPMSDEQKEKIRQSKLLHGEKYAKGFSVKQSGYVIYTRGEHKNRLVHVVAMEQKIGRKLFANEVVHHIDHNKSNNSIENLLLMTNKEHNKLHALENLHKRERNKNGKFK
jgi:hypothetical protein